MARSFASNPRFFKPKVKPVSKASIVKIDSLAIDGRGVARVEGKVCFVADSLPGETVKVRWSRHGGRFDEGRVQEVIEAAAGRIAPRCHYVDKCGGCSLQHADGAAQVEYKDALLSQQLRHLVNHDTVRLAPIVSPTFGYRSRARLAVFWHNNDHQLQLGFREQGSKRIIAIDSCPVLIPSLDALLQPLAAMLARLKGVKQLGHVELIDNDGQPAIAVRVTRKFVNADRKRLIAFGEQYKTKVVVIEGADEVVASSLWPNGSDSSFCYSVDGLKMHFAAGDFTQVNQQVNAQMVDQALALLDLQKDDHLLDLFCGVGNFSLSASNKVASVTGVEGVQSMVDKAVHNAAVNGIDNAYFACSDLSVQGGSALDWTRRADYNKMLLDPSREGAQEIVERLDRYKPERVVYVSCNPATLARDGAEMLKHGYRLASFGCIDMFPNTRHSEAMALFIRNNDA